MTLKHRRSSTMALRAAVVAAVLAVACTPADNERRPSGPSGSGPTSAAPTIEELSTTTFQGIYDHPVTLANGRWEGTPYVAGGASRPNVKLVPGLCLTGDLDGDGRKEAIVLLAESSGGSATRLYLAATAHLDGGVSNLGTVLIGDRVQVRAARLDGDRIVLDVLQAGPGDALCCPTQKARRSWRLEQGGLMPLTAEVTGTFSLADLDGSSWRLVEFGRGKPAPPEPAVLLRFEADKVVGQSGCNRYFGGVTEGETAGSLAFSAMGATRMACPEAVMTLESRYLAALAEASRYSFSAGRLVLSGEHGEDSSRLVFAPLEPEAAGGAASSDGTTQK